MRTSTDKTTPDKGPGKRRLALGRAPRTRSVVLATGMLVIGISPFAIAATGDALREGKRNGTTTSETEIIANIKSSTALKGGYGTRQSNLSSSGGGAIYGCRSKAGGSGAKPAPQNPCIRANNLSFGLAFEFNASNGDIAGAITVGAGGDSKKPFVTNATGVATGLNADRLDGANLSEILTATTTIAAKAATDAAATAKDRWVTIRENNAGDGAEIVAQTGGFKLVNCYTANSNCYIDAGEDMTNNALWAEILTENTPSAADNPGTDGANALAASTSVSPCFFDFVTCGPDGTDSGNGGNAGVFVVTPRNNDANEPVAPGDRYTFTAFVSAAQAAS
ncbi:MAG: hypothetical protein WKF48_01165 [Solirubrobacteraceae bacterium]